MIADVIARLKARVPDFGGRIEGAMELADLMKRNALPQAPLSAFVLPLGLQGGEANSANQYFTQTFDEAVGVMITTRTFTQTGATAVDPLEVLRNAVIAAIVGWGPPTALGVFRLLRATLVSMDAGTVVYQIDFALTDQLRIIVP